MYTYVFSINRLLIDTIIGAWCSITTINIYLIIKTKRGGIGFVLVFFIINFCFALFCVTAELIAL